ncbi:CDP-archaeol synthase [Candidatus Gracilibacteria bacterium]|nr:CDP-archaeol synthase [Candidatus Gracilibacteria bacterium]MCF7819229.1 CDP-archaeol synthase [Candidatus Gracilibacteria bacterium]
MDSFLNVFWLYLPAFLANGAPVVIRHVPGFRNWNTPLYASLLGTNKTWRGMISGIIVGALTGGIQFFFSDQWVWIGMTWGALLGFGALVGDAVESFVKRRLHIAPGKALPIWDGIDYILGALLLGAIWYVPSWQEILFLLILAPLLSLLSNIGAYFLKIKDVWY